MEYVVERVVVVEVGVLWAFHRKIQNKIETFVAHGHAQTASVKRFLE